MAALPPTVRRLAVLDRVGALPADADAQLAAWLREGLDLKTRSLVTIAMLTALGRSTELKGHVRGALNNGATAEELQEVLLHASVYCGLPTAVEAFRTAAEVIDGPAK